MLFAGAVSSDNFEVVGTLINMFSTLTNVFKIFHLICNSLDTFRFLFKYSVTFRRLTIRSYYFL